MTALRAEQVSAADAQHGEGPVWDARTGRLLLVDLEAGDLLELDAGGSLQRRPVDRVLAALRPRRSGGWVVALERGFRLLDEDFAPEGDEVRAFDAEGVRMNDGGCDPQGRFYCGSMAYDETEGAGALYRLDADGRVATVLSGVTISNGLQWSPDGSSVYYNDTPTGRIDRYDFDGETGTLHAGRALVTLGDGEGSPDGMAIDAEGCIWTACWGGAAVRRFDPDGAALEVVTVSAPNPTACAFGGPDGRTLYITTSKQGGEGAPGSGAVFAVDAGVRGGPVHGFAG